jgi:hypothetical protein
VTTEQWTAAVALAFGCAGILVFQLTRLRRNVELLLLGVAFVVGPLSPLLKDRVSGTGRIAFSVAANVLACGGAVVAMLRLRHLGRKH